MHSFPPKDPAAVLSYKFDFKAETNGHPDAEGDWLATSETISTRTITADTGITVVGSSLTDTNTSVTVTLSGGTHGKTYMIRCKIVTSASNEDIRSALVEVRRR